MNAENSEKYLPIGTVCLLKNGKKKVMITGYCIVPDAEKKVMYDYSACIYPEGVLSSDKTILFNHNQINSIYYLGYCDNDSKKFNDFLKKILSNIDKENINIDKQNIDNENDI